MALSSKKVAMDTNMLLAIAQFKVDVFGAVKEKLGAVRFAVPEEVMEELEKIAMQGKNRELEVRIALGEIAKNDVERLDASGGNADKSLIELSKRGFFVATNDGVLRKKIKMLGGKNIYLRQKKLIELE